MIMEAEGAKIYSQEKYIPKKYILSRKIYYQEKYILKNGCERYGAGGMMIMEGEGANWGER